MFAIAQDLLLEFGDNITLVEIVPGFYDPTTTEKNDTKTPHDTKAIIENVKDLKMNADGGTRPEIIFDADYKFTFAVDLNIDSLWEIIYNGKLHDIVSINPISTQDKIVLYEAYTRIQK
jgi:hypothetical protein